MNAATVLLVKVPQAQRLLATAAARQGPPGPNGPLGSLTDVDTAGVVEGQVLTYSPSLGGEPWKPRTLTELLAGSQETGPLRVVADVATNPVLVLTALPAQTGDYLQALDSVGAKVASIASNGAASFASGTTVGGAAVVVTTDPRLSDTRPPTGPAGGVLAGTYPNPTFAPSPTFQAPASTAVAVVMQGAVGQTAHLVDFVNSAGTLLSRVQADGAFFGPYFQHNSSSAYMLWSAGSPENYVPINQPAHIGLVIKGAATQTGDLQQWQGSTGVVSAHVGSSGDIYARSIQGGPVGVANVGVTASALAATFPALVTRGFAVQTANLQEWQNSAGTVLASVASTGNFSLSGGFASTGASSVVNSNDPVLFLQQNTPASRVLTVRGAVAQSVDLQQWQSSTGTVLSRAASDGGIYSGYFQNQTIGSYVLYNSGSPANLLIPAQPSHIVLAIRGAAAQTSDLAQWQDSASNILATIAAGGSWTVPDPSGVGGHRIGGAAASSTEFTVDTRIASFVGLVVRGRASQTADIAQFQNSTGTILAGVASNGDLYVNSTNRLITPDIVDSSAGAAKRISLHQTNIRAMVMGSTATDIGLVVQGAASQSASLQQWQNSSGTPVAYVYPDGTLSLLTGSGIGVLNVLPSGTTRPGIVVRGNPSQTANLLQIMDPNAVTVQTAFDLNGAMHSYGVIHTFDNLAIPTGVAAALNTAASTLVIGTTYYYVVTAVNAAGETMPSAQVSAIPAAGNAAVALSWTAVTGAVSYRVYRSTVNGTFTSPALVGTGITTTSFTDTGFAVSAGTPPGNGVGTGSTRLILNAWYGQGGDLQQWVSPTGGGVASAVWAGGGFAIGTASRLGGAWLSVSNLNHPSNEILSIRGAAAQTGDLQQWQNSAGTVQSSVSSAGNFYAPAMFPGGQNFGGVLSVATGTATGIGEIIRGAASQSADLTQWQNSAGTVLSSVRNDGRLVVNSIQNVPGGAWLFVSGDPSNKLGNSGSTAARVLVIQGAVSQSGPLTEWQDSTGAAVAQMLNAGSMRAPSFGSTAGSKALLLTGFDTGGFVVSTVADANKGLAIRRNSTAATANLFETQSETGVPNSVISPFGAAVFGGSAVIGRVTTYTASATTVGQVIQGAASQTSDLQQWQNSAAAVLAKVDAGGIVYGTQLRTILNGVMAVDEQSGGYLRMTRQTAQAAVPPATTAKLYLRDGTTVGTLKLVVLGPGNVETTIVDNIA